MGDLKEYWPDIVRLPYYSKFVREHCSVAEKTHKDNYTTKLKNYLKNIESKSKYLRQTIDDDCFDLIERCLRINPSERISAADAVKHPWFAKEPKPDSTCIPYMKEDIHE